MTTALPDAALPGLVMLCLGLGLAFSIPPLVISDEAQHVDYAWNLLHGRIPAFDDGVTAPLGAQQWLGPQFVSNHPPLAHLILAPVVGALLEAGRPNQAIAGGRFLMVTTAVIVVFLAAGLARAVAPHARWAPSAAGLLTVASAPLVMASVVVFTDVPMVATATATLLIAVKGVRDGFRAGNVALLALVGAVGLWMRAGFIAAVLAAGFAVLLAPGPWRSVATRSLQAATVVVVPMLATAVWWGRNLEISGSLSGLRPGFTESLGREIRSPIDVALDPTFYLDLAGRFWPLEVRDGFVSRSSLSVLAVASLVALLAARCCFWLWTRPRPPELVTAGTLFVPVGVTLAGVVLHVANGGWVNPRYLLPALPSLIVGLALALPNPRRLPLLLATLLAATGYLTVIGGFAMLLQARRYPDDGLLGSLSRGMAELGVAGPWLVAVAWGAGLLLLAWTLTSNYLARVRPPTLGAGHGDSWEARTAGQRAAPQSGNRLSSARE